MKACRLEQIEPGVKAYCLDHQLWHYGHTIELSQQLTKGGKQWRDGIKKPFRSLTIAKECKYLGELLSQQEIDEKKLAGCRSCDNSIVTHHCNLPGAKKFNDGPYARPAGECTNCHDWKAKDTIIDNPSFGLQGVVIGSYGMPGVVELSIAMIRKTCGDVPILIADDCTPESMGMQRLLDMPAKWPGVSLHMSGENLGHAPGDIRAYRNGLRWAEKNGISYLCKLSQRFIFTGDKWLQDVCREMEIHGYAVSSQRAVHLNMQFQIRSECVFMDVKKCMASERFMARLDPPGGKIPTSAEDWLHAGINEGGLLPVHRCRRIPVDRFEKRHDLIWHNSDSSDDYNESHNAYHDLAKELGIDLGPEFSGAGWHVLAAHRPDAHYHML